MQTKNNKLIHGTAKNFDQEVTGSDLPVVVDFYADWCAPCRMLAPVFQKMAEDYAGQARFVKVNVDEEASLANRFGISGIPTMIFFKDGAVADSATGLLPPEEIKAKVNHLIK